MKHQQIHQDPFEMSKEVFTLVTFSKDVSFNVYSRGLAKS